MFRLLLLSLVACALAMGGPAAAQRPAGAFNAPQRHMAIQLVAETDMPRGGSSFDLAFRMVPQPGWHGYWKNPGDSGLEPTIAWQLPSGVKIDEFRYPVPHRLLVAGLMNYVYEGPYALLAKVRLDPGLASGTRLPLRGKFDYLVCTKEVCVPESADVAIDLVVGDGSVPAGRAAEFDGYRKALPQPLGVAGRFEASADRFRLAVPLPAETDAGDAYFYPLTDGALDYAAEQKIGRNGDWLIVDAKAGPGSPNEVAGVLQLGDRGLSLTAKPGPVPVATAAAASTEADYGQILTILLAALAGGLLLNVMPCVFPILSLKALSLAKGGGEETQVRREALAYTAGAVLTCAALGAAVLVLRAGGSAAGWAFQLQDPRVILVLLLLVTAIALNLAGLFELPSLGWGDKLSKRSGAAGAFWTGGLAAFVATPCTGPFMATALGAALILPPAQALAVFAFLGLGLALPFLIIGFVPAVRRKLPKPGPWMATFRRILSVPMFLTALALAWILGRQSGVAGMTIGLAAVLLGGLILWWLGRSETRLRSMAAILAVAIVTAAAILVLPLSSAAATSEGRGALASNAFSEERLAASRAGGTPVFAYFTADWCITCKVNEKTVLERKAVADAFAKNKVEVLVGDWTNGDPAIGRFLEKHGRTGVPLYVFYPVGGEAQVLPQLLTVSGVISTVEKGS